MTSDPAHQHHGIDYTEIGALDLDAAADYYGRAFGWTFTDYGATYKGFAFADGREGGGLAPVSSVRPGGPLVILYSGNLEATLAAVKDAGGLIEKETYAFPGGRRFHFKDPSGNELAVWGI